MQFFSLIFTASLLLIASQGYSLSNVWTPTATIATGDNSVNPGGPFIAIDTHSNTVTGWLAAPGPSPTGGENFSAYLPAPTTAWNPQELIFSDAAPLLLAFPIIFTNNKDQETAAWGELDIGNVSFSLYASRRNPGATGWPTPVVTSFPGLSFGGEAHAGKTGNLNALLVLSSTGTPPFQIATVALPNGSSSWSPVTPIDTDNSSSPLAANNIYDNIATLAWKNDTPSLHLGSSRYTFPAGTITPVSNIPLPGGTTDIVTLKIEVDSSNNSMAFFTIDNGATKEAYVSILFAASTTWSAPILISNPANNAFALSLMAGPSGASYLLWGELDGGSNGYIYSARISLAGVTSGLTLLSGPIAGATGLDPSSNIVVDVSENVVATWEVTDATDSIIQVASKAVGQGWVPALTLSLTGKTPKVVLSNQGKAVVAWIDSVSGNFLSSTNLALFPVQAPTTFVGEIIKNRFLNVNEYALKMTWVSDPILNIDKFIISKNGKVIGTVAGSKREFIAYLSSKKTTATYTIVAVATNGNTSDAVILQIIN